MGLSHHLPTCLEDAWGEEGAAAQPQVEILTRSAFFFLFGLVAVKAEEWKTRFSILHFQVGCWCYGKTTKLQVDDIQLDWTGLLVPVSRDNGDDYEEEEYKGDDDAGVGGPDDDYVNDDGDDDDDQG